MESKYNLYIKLKKIKKNLFIEEVNFSIHIEFSQNMVPPPPALCVFGILGKLLMSEVHWVGLVMLIILVQELLNIEQFLSLKIFLKTK